MIVEADDGADELPQLHEVNCDDVDAVLPGPLRSDPLHHAGQGPEEGGKQQERQERVGFTQGGATSQLETISDAARPRQL